MLILFFAAAFLLAGRYVSAPRRFRYTVSSEASQDQPAATADVNEVAG
jgi:hypothetical protein